MGTKHAPSVFYEIDPYDFALGIRILSINCF
jgi:hypothetical protein